MDSHFILIEVRIAVMQLANTAGLEAFGALGYHRIDVHFQKVIGYFQDLDRHHDMKLCQ